MWETSISCGVLAHPTCRGNSAIQHPHQSVSSATWSSYATQPDDQLAFFLVMALFRAARFSRPLISTFRSEGDEDGEAGALVVSLEMKGVIRLRNLLHFHSSESRSSSLSPLSGKRSDLSPSPQPLISLFWSQSLSSDLHRTTCIDVKKQDL